MAMKLLVFVLQFLQLAVATKTLAVQNAVTRSSDSGARVAALQATDAGAENATQISCPEKATKENCKKYRTGFKWGWHKGARTGYRLGYKRGWTLPFRGRTPVVKELVTSKWCRTSANRQKRWAYCWGWNTAYHRASIKSFWKGYRVAQQKRYDPAAKSCGTLLQKVPSKQAEVNLAGMDHDETDEELEVEGMDEMTEGMPDMEDDDEETEEEPEDD